MYPVWEKLEWGNVPWKFEETRGILTFIGSGTLGDESSSPWKRKDEMRIEASKTKKLFSQRMYLLLLIHLLYLVKWELQKMLRRID